MIRRSLLVFAVLVLAYAAFIHFSKLELDTSQHQSSGNRIKAEQFVFGADAPDATVIVGSSLSFRIELDSLPPGTSNLGFGGLSVYDGLELITRANKKPARVLIETNMIFKEPDRGFLDAVFQPGLYELRRSVPILREENQPSGVLIGLLRDRAKKGRPVEEAPSDSMAMSTVLLETNRASFAVLPADSTQQRYLTTLEREVKAMEARGVEVIFMEVPIAPEMMTSVLATRCRTLITERFPTHRFLRTDPGLHWRTTDGLHLEEHNARRYSGWLARSLRP